MSSLVEGYTADWRYEIEERTTGNLNSYAEARKMKSLTLHANGLLRTGLGYCPSSLLHLELDANGILLSLIELIGVLHMVGKYFVTY